MARISVVIPTVKGREGVLKTCIRGYQKHSVNQVEIIIMRDRPTCGRAWLESLPYADGDYIHFTADDLEPHEGWDQDVIEMASNGIQPSPRIIYDGAVVFCGNHLGAGAVEPETGTVVGMSVIPFLSREMLNAVLPLLDAHYYTDDWISWQLERKGYQTQCCRTYEFEHHVSNVKRGAGMSQTDRMFHDRLIYEAARRAM